MALGLPPLPLPTTPETHRALEIWLQACIERVDREARMQQVDGAEHRGRVNGAKQMALLLSETLTPAKAGVESPETGGST